MKLTPDQKEALEIVEVTGDWSAIISQVEFLMEWAAAERETETVHRCLQTVDAVRTARERIWSHEVNPETFGEQAEKAIRALSPDPHAKERWELDAKVALCDFLVAIQPRLTKAEVLDERGRLKRQLAALPGPKKQLDPDVLP